MSIELDIEVEMAAALDGLDAVARKQIPFAMSRTLTLLAQEAVSKKRSKMPSIFKIRSKRVVKGISMLRAEKSDWPLMEATVGSKDYFMVLQETGGAKRAEKGKHVAIPSKAVRRTTTGRVRASHKPKAILGKKTGSIGSGAGGLVIRRKPTKRNPLSTMFLLRRRALVKPALGLLDTTEKVVESQYSRVFGRELGKALASS